ncbi:MAG: hypothetical protein ACRD0K_10055 [Egibacteraceae bacterium]
MANSAFPQRQISEYVWVQEVEGSSHVNLSVYGMGVSLSRLEALRLAAALVDWVAVKQV